MTIVELAPDDARLADVWPVMLELRDHLDTGSIAAMYAEAYPQGYRVAGLFAAGRCVAAAGYRYGTSFANGRYLYVEDLVTANDSRSKGHGKALIDHLVAEATAKGCDCITLDSGVHRYDAHRFYLRERFVISSHHFFRQLRDGAAASSMRAT